MLDNHVLFKIIDKKDEFRKEINSYILKNSYVCSESLEYPIIEFKKEGADEIINPIFERTMSLSKINQSFFKKNINKKITNTEKNPVFFFCFNFDNYFHFIYDTLPYLISYFELKKEIKELKLLVSNTNFLKFVSETFILLDINKDDFIEISNNTIYTEIYYSDSLTHGIDSNLPPHKKSKEIYQKLIEESKKRTSIQSTPKYMYISRRTWLHNNLENIGTDYTSRRKLTNETELTEFLTLNNFEEIFTENLSMSDKIIYFNNVDILIGPIGGGLVNCLFCNENCKLIVINSPLFLDINERFKFCFNQTENTIFKYSYHTHKGEWKKYQRVLIKDKNLLGEILEIKKNRLLVNVTDTIVSGFSMSKKFNKIWFKKNQCEKLDEGLNSPYKINLKKFKKKYEEWFDGLLPKSYQHYK
jgi:hypothetical protein